MGTEKKLAAAYCKCQTVFEYEDRDVFAGEIFCPLCMTRIKPEDKYSSLKEAQKEHPSAQHYSTV